MTTQQGADGDTLPLWASTRDNPVGLSTHHNPALVVRRDLSGVPCAFQLLNVLSPGECQLLIEAGEALGYTRDAPLSLPREIRHNDNVVWVTDPETDAIVWQRIRHLLVFDDSLFEGKQPVGLNARWRFYRYSVDDFFKFHTDGAWPGSRVMDGQLQDNAYPDRFSRLTLLLFLNDDFEGGATRFLVNADDPAYPARYYNRAAAVDVRTPAGAALCFPHGNHPLQCTHSAELITRGCKYIIRTDVLFEC